MGDRTVKITVSREEQQLLKKIGGSAPRGLKKLVNLAFKSKLAKNQVDMFVDNCVVVTYKREDRETLKDVYSAYLIYCKDINKTPSHTKQQMRKHIEDLHSGGYGRVSPSSYGFFGIQLL